MFFVATFIHSFIHSFTHFFIGQRASQMWIKALLWKVNCRCHRKGWSSCDAGDSVFAKITRMDYFILLVRKPSCAD
jgi:hypothetical protein